MYKKYLFLFFALILCFSLGAQNADLPWSEVAENQGEQTTGGTGQGSGTSGSNSASQTQPNTNSSTSQQTQAETNASANQQAQSASSGNMGAQSSEIKPEEKKNKYPCIRSGYDPCGCKR